MFKKLISTLLLISLALFSSELDIDAKIFPTILKYDLQLRKKLVNSRVQIAIIYPKLQSDRAFKLKGLIEKKGQFSFQLIEENRIGSLKRATAIYLFDIESGNLDRVIKFAKENSLLTFSDSPQLLRYGVTVSLLHKRRVRPVLNLEALRESSISLSSTLLKVSFFYEK